MDATRFTKNMKKKDKASHFSFHHYNASDMSERMRGNSREEILYQDTSVRKWISSLSFKSAIVPTLFVLSLIVIITMVAKVMVLEAILNNKIDVVWIFVITFFI